MNNNNKQSRKSQSGFVYSNGHTLVLANRLLTLLNFIKLLKSRTPVRENGHRNGFLSELLSANKLSNKIAFSQINRY